MENNHTDLIDHFECYVKTKYRCEILALGDDVSGSCSQIVDKVSSLEKNANIVFWKLSETDVQEITIYHREIYITVPLKFINRLGTRKFMHRNLFEQKSTQKCDICFVKSEGGDRICSLCGFSYCETCHQELLKYPERWQKDDNDNFYFIACPGCRS